MTASFHRFGEFFPGTGDVRVSHCSKHQPGRGQCARSWTDGYVQDIGMKRGKGYAVNVPLRDGIRDESFHSIFKPVWLILLISCYATTWADAMYTGRSCNTSSNSTGQERSSSRWVPTRLRETSWADSTSLFLVTRAPHYITSSLSISSRSCGVCKVCKELQSPDHDARRRRLYYVSAAGLLGVVLTSCRKNVARAWTYETAVMCGKTLSEDLPYNQ